MHWCGSQPLTAVRTEAINTTERSSSIKPARPLEGDRPVFRVSNIRSFHDDPTCWTRRFSDYSRALNINVSNFAGSRIVHR
jgi:hypothetical protein